MRELKRTLSAYIIGSLVFVCERVPPFVRYAIANVVGWIFAQFPGQMRRLYEQNLRFALPHLQSQAASLRVKIFRNFSITLCDFFVPRDLIVDVPDRSKLEAVRAGGKGVLMLTFHMGHWELGARVMQSWGWPVTAVYQPYSNRAYRKLIESHRAPGVNFIAVGGHAATGVREALRRGDMVAMLGDHPFGEDGTPVQLFGRRVMWPKGPILLAVREKCPIMVAVVVRTSLGHYQGFVEEALVPASSTRAEAQRLVQGVANIFEKFARRYPEQWYRFRPFDVAPDENSSVAAKERDLR